MQHLTTIDVHLIDWYFLGYVVNTENVSAKKRKSISRCDVCQRLSENYPPENCPVKSCTQKIPPQKIATNQNCSLWKYPAIKVPTSENPPLKIAPLKITPKKITPRKLTQRKLSPMKVATIVVRNWKLLPCSPYAVMKNKTWWPVWWSWVSWKYTYPFNLTWIVVFL